MSDNTFEVPGSLAAPRLVGRLARLGLGVLSLWVFVYNFLSLGRLVDGQVNVLHVIAAAFTFWYLPDLTNVTFSRNWGRTPQSVVAVAAVVVLAIGWAVDGQAWSLVLSWFVFLFIGVGYGVFAVSFLLAGLFAVPG